MDAYKINNNSSPAIFKADYLYAEKHDPEKFMKNQPHIKMLMLNIERERTGIVLFFVFIDIIK